MQRPSAIAARTVCASETGEPLATAVGSADRDASIVSGGCGIGATAGVNRVRLTPM